MKNIFIFLFLVSLSAANATGTSSPPSANQNAPAKLKMDLPERMLKRECVNGTKMLVKDYFPKFSVIPNGRQEIKNIFGDTFEGELIRCLKTLDNCDARRENTSTTSVVHTNNLVITCGGFSGGGRPIKPQVR